MGFEFCHDGAVLRIRVKAFTCDHPRSWNDVCVDDDGVVWVFDGVARHFTRCHSMSENAKSRVRKLWRQALSDTLGARFWWMPGEWVAEAYTAALRFKDDSGKWTRRVSIDAVYRLRERAIQSREDEAGGVL